MSSAANRGEDEQGATRAAALIITGIDGIESLAAELAGRLHVTIELASSRQAGLRLLGRRGYVIVVVDQILADSDPEGCELIWKNAGTALPLQINFALAGSARLEREIRGALARREREKQLAWAAAAAAMDDEVKNAITGFLLESQLALGEVNLPPRVESRLRRLAEIADQLRERVQPTVARDTTSVPLIAQPK